MICGHSDSFLTFAEQAAFLYRWAGIFKDELLDPVLVPDRQRLPDPVIGFEQMRIETLAAYTLVRNPQGLLYEITFNTEHFITEDGHQAWRFGQYGQLETLLHELIHLWQQNFGQHPIEPGKVTHNPEFVHKCEYFGLHPKRGSGAHTRIADGLFAECMKRYGIAQPDTSGIPEDNLKDWFRWLLTFEGKRERKGRSTLTLYQCPCGQNIRVGKKNWPGAVCKACGGEYQQARVELVLYQAEEPKPQKTAEAAKARESLRALLEQAGVSRARVGSCWVELQKGALVLKATPAASAQLPDETEAKLAVQPEDLCSKDQLKLLEKAAQGLLPCPRCARPLQGTLRLSPGEEVVLSCCVECGFREY